MSNDSDRKPVADDAEADAYFPSPFSLTQYVAPKTDFDGADYPNAQKGGKWKVLLIATQERYLEMADGKFFSTGNHPVEMLLPMLHLDAAGFEIDIATVSGNPVKFEMWAFPREDAAVKGIYEKYKQKIRHPLNLSEVWGNGFTEQTPYLAVFVPGGHGALNCIRARRDGHRGVSSARRCRAAARAPAAGTCAAAAPAPGRRGRRHRGHDDAAARGGRGDPPVAVGEPAAVVRPVEREGDAAVGVPAQGTRHGRRPLPATAVRRGAARARLGRARSGLGGCDVRGPG